MKKFPRFFNHSLQVLSGWVLLGLAVAAGSARGEALLIGYTNCQAVAQYPQARMNQIAQFKWYFAHASVGGNLMSGITDLRAVSSTLYPIQSTAEDAVPPATTLPGRIYEDNRGNPGWQAKMDLFGSSISNGWRFPAINVAVNKLCYIDETANLAYYLSAMSRLEAAFPETVFVYMTIPLTTDTDYANFLRNVFNDSLRDWVRANSRVLYDIADIEAHDTSGTASTFTYNNRLCQRLYNGYTDDGGHLNTTGRQLAAKGFYALAAGLLDADRDGDRLSDGCELLAGTNPGDPKSVFSLANPKTENGSIVLRWPSAANRVYTLQASPQLQSSSFTNVMANLAPTPPWNTQTVTLPSGNPLYFRVLVRQ